MEALAKWEWNFDGWIILIGSLCAVAASLLGNYLVLRRMSLLGDAISHAVLPGLAAAFIISGSRASIPMFIGAVVVGVLTALFTEWIRGVGKVDEGASMGVVFTSLFALGLVMIVQAADHVDLDPGCVLYGAIEFTPLDRIEVLGRSVPRAVVTLSAVALINLVFVVLFRKELKLASFDPALATTSGFNATLMHYLLMVLVAVTAVASFEAVGNILVVAMFVVPPAAAYMLTDRLSHMIVLSSLLAVLSATSGHVGAMVVPSWFGFGSVATAAMMAVSSGVVLLLAVAFGPRHGVVVKLIRQRLLSWRILADDVIALLYRLRERNVSESADLANLQDSLLADRMSLAAVLRWLSFKGEIELQGDAYRLTKIGRHHARALVRSHRLWEQYLVSEADYSPDRIHDKAETFEHFTDRQLREHLEQETSGASLDPHGAIIPPEDEDPAR